MGDGNRNLDIGRRLSIIDVSTVEDSLIDSFSDGSTFLQPPGLGTLLEIESCEQEPARIKLTEQMDLLRLVEDASEPSKTRRVPKCNLRQSLAWDSAFFTSEGVLDPDELAMVTKTFKKAEALPLPAIEEDMRRSAESNSTLGAESWALETLEVDLFEQFRASARLSDDESDKASDISSSSGKAGSSKRSPLFHGTAGQKQKPASMNKIKPASLMTKRQSLSKGGSNKALEAVSHLKVEPSKRRDQKCPLKPPNVVSKSKPLLKAPSKHTSMSASDTTKRKAGSGNEFGRQPSAAKHTIPSSIPSKSYSSTLPESEVNYSKSTSASIGKSIRKTSEKKNPSGNSGHSSLGSVVKSPCHVLTKNIQQGKMNTSSSLVPELKFTSTSPASSLDEFSSSESSLSSPTAKQRLNNSKASSDSSSSSYFLAANALERVSPLLTNMQDCTEVTGPGLGCQFVKRATSGNNIIHQPPAMNTLRSRVHSNSCLQVKPSGLRLPSPKIGFFDADKLASRASNGPLQAHCMQPRRFPNSASGGTHQVTLKLKKSSDGLQPSSSASGMKPVFTSMPLNQSIQPVTTEVVDLSQEVQVSKLSKHDQHLEFKVEASNIHHLPKNNCELQRAEQCLLMDAKVASPTESDAQLSVEGVDHSQKNLPQKPSIANLSSTFIKEEVGQTVCSTSISNMKGSYAGLASSTCVGAESPSTRTPLARNSSLCNMNGSFPSTADAGKRKTTDEAPDPTLANNYFRDTFSRDEKENTQDSNCSSFLIHQQ